MPKQYFARQIEVTTGGDIKVPVSFKLGDREYQIAEVLESWPDHGYGNYYRVKTAEGEVYEIYYDRGTKLTHPELKKWYLTRQL